MTPSIGVATGEVTGKHLLALVSGLLIRRHEIATVGDNARGNIISWHVKMA